jgi:hypothetical protein
MQFWVQLKCTTFSALYAGGEEFKAEPIHLMFDFLRSTINWISTSSDNPYKPPYVETRYPVNVYTVFYVYWYDLGWLALAWWFLLGIAFEWVFRMHQQAPSFKSFGLLTLVLPLVVLSTFYDYFTSSGFVYLAIMYLLLLHPTDAPRTTQQTPPSI